MATTRITWQGIFLRFLFAFTLVFATYNPEQYSYYHWVIEQLPDFNVLKIFTGVVLLIGWAIFIRASLRSLGPVGLVLAFAFFGSLVWLTIDYGLLSSDSTRSMTYLAQVVLASVLAIGISWSHVRRRLTGQVDVDETDD